MRATYACGESSADLVVDVDLVHDRGRELALVLGDEHDAAAVVGRARPLDHHRHAGGLEPAAEHLGLDPGPFADLDQTAPSSSPSSSSEPVRCVGSSVTSATRQSAHRLVPARYSAPHDGHHRLGSSTGGECTGVASVR